MSREAIESDELGRRSDDAGSAQRTGAGPAVDARSLGVKPERAQRPHFRGDGIDSRKLGSFSAPAVDARSLGAGREGAQRSFPNTSVGAGTSSGSNRSAIDARDLGARVEGSQGSFMIQKVPMDSRLGRQIVSESLGIGSEAAQDYLNFRRFPASRSSVESRDPSEGLMAQPHNSQGGNGAQTHPSTNMDTFKQRSFIRKANYQHTYPAAETDTFEQRSLQRKSDFRQRPYQGETNRYTGSQRAGKASQASQSRFSVDETRSQGRSTGGEDSFVQSGRSRAGRPRARNSDDPGPRRRKGDIDRRFQDNYRRGPKMEKSKLERLKYLDEILKRKPQVEAQEYEPVEFSRETFTGIDPMTRSNELGMSEILGERLLLARKYLGHEFIQWDSKEQKADVMAVVEKLKSVREERKIRRKVKWKPNGSVENAETASPKSADGDEQVQALMQKLIAGEYAKFDKATRFTTVVHQVQRDVRRNDSFYPDDEKSLVEKVRSIMLDGETGRRARRLKVSSLSS